MPCRSSSEHIRRHRVTWHLEVLFIHKRSVEVLVLDKQLQSQTLYIEIGIYIHHGIVAYLFLVLHAKLSQRRVQDRCIVFCEEAHIYTYLCVKCFEPTTVII